MIYGEEHCRRPGTTTVEEQRRLDDQRLANAPAWFINGINEHRRRAGLPLAQYRGSLDRALCEAFPPPSRRRAIEKKTAGEIARTAKVRRGIPWGVDAATSSNTITRLWIVACPGQAERVHTVDGRGGIRWRDLPERIDYGAFDIEKLNNPRGPIWDLRCGHKGKPVISNLSGRLRCETWPRGGLVIEARLDPTIAAHRDLAAKVRALDPAVSIEFYRRAVRMERGVGGRLFELVTKADLVHVALLTNGETPAYSRAHAFVMDGPSHEAERQRQRDAVIDKALSRP